MLFQADTSSGMLARSKDRAQLTASTAMSVANVALLRELLDRGPEANPYFTVAISLVSASLALQIIAGILSLTVANILRYAHKYESNPCRDARENLCPCYCVKARPDKRGSSEKTVSSIETGEFERCTSETARPYEALDVHVPCCSCCSYGVVANVYHPQEYYVIRMSQRMQREIIDAKVKNIEHAGKLKYQPKLLAAAQARLQETRGMRDSRGEAHQKAMEDKVRSLQAEIENCQNSVARYKWRKQQSEELAKLAKQITKKRLMKVVSFWQDIINYIFFIVFILNTFVVGFGVANSNSTVSPGGDGVGVSGVTTTGRTPNVNHATD